MEPLVLVRDGGRARLAYCSRPAVRCEMLLLAILSSLVTCQREMMIFKMLGNSMIKILNVPLPPPWRHRPHFRCAKRSASTVASSSRLIVATGCDGVQ
eukprot:scaffold19152_cov31-Tisochrysis_lutea.AAC.2